MLADVAVAADGIGNRRILGERPAGGPVSRALSAFGGALAITVMLMLLMVRRCLVAVLDSALYLANRSTLSSWISRNPITMALAASLIGAAVAVASDTAFLPSAGGTWGFAASFACLAILIIAAPLAFQAVGDPYAVPAGRVPRALRAFYARAARHPLDGAWLEVLLVSALLIAPPFVALLAHRNLSPGTALLFATVICAVRHPLVDFEHGDSHYAFLRPRAGARRADRLVFRAMDWLARYPFALITARIPNWYAVQHVAVHHAENNGLSDNQSTAPYDRSTFSGFAKCLQKFALSGLFPIDVARYLLVRRRLKPLRKLCLGYAVYVCFLIALGAYDPCAAVLFIAIRYLSLLADGASFFQEHGLVDPGDPDEVVTNSLHYINHNDHGTRGEDLHVEHHRRPGLHWTHYPERVNAHREEYARLQAIGFHDGPGQLEVYFRCLWRQDFAGLAQHIKVFGGDHLTAGDVARILRNRTAPAGKIHVELSALELRLGRFASALI